MEDLPELPPISAERMAEHKALLERNRKVIALMTDSVHSAAPILEQGSQWGRREGGDAAPLAEGSAQPVAWMYTRKEDGRKVLDFVPNPNSLNQWQPLFAAHAARADIAALAAMASEYEDWIDFYHAGRGDYRDFLRGRL